MYCTDGVWLGNPRNPQRRVLVKDISREVVDRAEINGTTPEKLAVNLLSTMFSPQELARGNVTKPRKEGIIQLDPELYGSFRYMVWIQLHRVLF